MRRELCPHTSVGGHVPFAGAPPLQPRRGTRPPNPRLNAWRLYQISPFSSSARLALPAEARAPAGAAAAPPRSPRSAVKRVFLCLIDAGAPPLRPRQGTLHPPRPPYWIVMAVGLQQIGGLAHSVRTGFCHFVHHLKRPPSAYQSAEACYSFMCLRFRLIQLCPNPYARGSVKC